MKKLISLFILTILCITLASCSTEDKEKTTTLEKKISGGKITMTFTHKGDKVLKLHQIHNVPYSVYGATDKEATKHLLEQEMKDTAEFRGYKESFKFGEDNFIGTVDIDFTILDPEEAKVIPGLNFTGDLEKGISLEKTMKELEGENFIIIKQ